MIGVAGTGDFFPALVAGEVFFDANKSFPHKFDNGLFSDRILEVNNLIKSVKEIRLGLS